MHRIYVFKFSTSTGCDATGISGCVREKKSSPSIDDGASTSISYSHNLVLQSLEWRENRHDLFPIGKNGNNKLFFFQAYSVSVWTALEAQRELTFVEHEKMAFATNTFVDRLFILCFNLSSELCLNFYFQLTWTFHYQFLSNWLSVFNIPLFHNAEPEIGNSTRHSVDNRCLLPTLLLSLYYSRTYCSFL